MNVIDATLNRQRPDARAHLGLVPMLRIARRATLLFASYAGLLLAVIMAGFLGSAFEIRASVLWGAAVLGGLALYACHRQRRRREDQESGLSVSKI